MRVYQIDPIQDARWAEFVARHPKASVFHTVPWLKALRKTYGYEPVAFTTSPPTGALQNGLVFCRVKSWLTGRRLVSLPFSDHCEPLCDSLKDLQFLVRYLQASLEHEEWKYVEIRPIEISFGQMGDGIDFSAAIVHSLHTLDLRPELDDVFRSLDKDSVQRRIQRAGRAGLVQERGRSERLLKDFYALFVITRGKHRVPPSPLAWFRNLVLCLGEALEIRLAYKDGLPMAAILTLQHNGVVYYKYGCSDPRFNKLGVMPWLLWNAIADAKSTGVAEFDMGRTDEADAGLLAFKNHWVSRPQRLVYWRFPDTFRSLDSSNGWRLRMAKSTFSHMPNGLLTIAGRLLYRHIG